MPSNSENIYSVIDIGTNTCLLLIASVEKGELRTIFEKLEIPRIGYKLYETGIISEERMQIACDVFRKYVSYSKQYSAKKIFAFGTSALREAGNSSEFIEFIKKETGVNIKIISGEEEAKYAYEGAVFDFDNSKNYAVIDIGGGSTEISFTENSKLKSVSVDIGSVRLYENFFKNDLSETSFNSASHFITQNLRDLKYDNTVDRKLVGVAGTVTTLSAILNRLNDFDESIIHKDEITIDEIINITKMLYKMSDNERLHIGNYMKGRSDIIVSGALILGEVMKHLNFSKVTVSTKGLRYGLMLNIADFNI